MMILPLSDLGYLRLTSQISRARYERRLGSHCYVLFNFFLVEMIIPLYFRVFQIDFFHLSRTDLR